LDAGKDGKSAPAAKVEAKPAAKVDTKPADAKPKAEGDKPADEPKLEVDGSVGKHFAELKRQREALEAEKAKVKADAEKAKKEAADALKISEQERAEFEAFKKLKAEAKKKPYEALRALDLTGDDIAKGLMHEEPEVPAVVQTLQQRVDQLEAELKAEREQKQSAEQAEIDKKNVANMMAKLEETLKAPEFPRARKDPQLVYGVVEQHFVNTFNKETGRGEILDFRRAAEEVEKYLAKVAEPDKAEEPGEKKSEAAPAEGPKGSQKAPAKEPPQKPVVLSNKTNADTPPGDPPPDPAANKKRAIRLLQERMAAKRAAFAGASQ
jgi:hypothetical protein